MGTFCQNCSCRWYRYPTCAQHLLHQTCILPAQTCGFHRTVLPPILLPPRRLIPAGIFFPTCRLSPPNIPGLVVLELVPFVSLLLCTPLPPALLRTRGWTPPPRTLPLPARFVLLFRFLRSTPPCLPYLACRCSVMPLLLSVPLMPDFGRNYPVALPRFAFV